MFTTYFDPQKKCSENQMFEITKTRDFNSCLNRTAFNVNQHGVYKCRRGQFLIKISGICIVNKNIN